VRRGTVETPLPDERLPSTRLRLPGLPLSPRSEVTLRLALAERGAGGSLVTALRRRIVGRLTRSEERPAGSIFRPCGGPHLRH
jgi:hypothetical protein